MLGDDPVGTEPRRVLIRAFASDWAEGVLCRPQIQERVGRLELVKVRELLWANYPQLLDLFSRYSGSGENPFMLDVREFKALLQSCGVQDMQRSTRLNDLPDSVGRFDIGSIFEDVVLRDEGRTARLMQAHFPHVHGHANDLGDSTVGMSRAQFLEAVLYVALDRFFVGTDPPSPFACVQRLLFAHLLVGGNTTESPTRSTKSNDDTFRSECLLQQDVLAAFETSSW